MNIKADSHSGGFLCRIMNSAVAMPWCLQAFDVFYHLCDTSNETEAPLFFTITALLVNK